MPLRMADVARNRSSVRVAAAVRVCLQRRGIDVSAALRAVVRDPSRYRKASVLARALRRAGASLTRSQIDGYINDFLEEHSIQSGAITGWYKYMRNVVARASNTLKPEEIDDLIQDFIVSVLVENADRTIDTIRRKGLNFRTYVAVSLRSRVIDLHHTDTAQKRDKGKNTNLEDVSLTMTPEEASRMVADDYMLFGDMDSLKPVYEAVKKADPSGRMKSVFIGLCTGMKKGEIAQYLGVSNASVSRLVRSIGGIISDMIAEGTYIPVA